jgi:hypothetical protein
MAELLISAPFLHLETFLAVSLFLPPYKIQIKLPNEKFILKAQAKMKINFPLHNVAKLERKSLCRLEPHHSLSVPAVPPIEVAQECHRLGNYNYQFSF